jgi:hypothetical protein
MRMYGTSKKNSIVGTLGVAIAFTIAVGHGCVRKVERGSEIGGFSVKLDSADRGTADTPLPFSVDNQSRTVDIQALKNDGSGAMDTSYTGWITLHVLPTGKLDRSPLAVKIVDGRADNVEVKYSLSYGDVRIVAVDEGYVPREGDLAGAACNNGLDDDGDGFIDMKDLGCLLGGDDTEWASSSQMGLGAAEQETVLQGLGVSEFGHGATGASEVIYYANPRIEDVQTPIGGAGSGGDASVLKQERVSIDGGWILVARVGVDGLYVVDMEGQEYDGNGFVIQPIDLSFRSVFAFNFSTPRNLQEGDCLVSLDGTVEEFFGYTELGKPTWNKGDYEFCAAKARGAKVPDSICPAEQQLICSDSKKDCKADKAVCGDNETCIDPCRKVVEELINTPVDITTLMVDNKGAEVSVWDDRTLELERFESALVQVSNVTVFTELRDCDSNGNGTLDFYIDAESDCSDDCGDLTKCVIGETYRRYTQWTVHFKDGAGEERELAVVSAGAIPDFDPLKAQGKTLSKIVGTLRHLTFGRPAWILEPRRPAECPDCVTE